MYSSKKVPALALHIINQDEKLNSIERILLIASFFNLLIVSLLGLLLRFFPLIDGLPLEYKNVLHGHSHFAFGGWLMPVLLMLIMKYFPELRQTISYTHWRNTSSIFLLSAYGMLLSFPFMGYKPASIFFSTLSVAGSFYLFVIIRNAWKGKPLKLSQKFLSAGLFFLILSSIGPFATGPLIAMGQQGSPLYFNAIYFYLHFQINGWFLFAVLAVLYKIFESSGKMVNSKQAYLCFTIACIPAFFLSVLWNQPPLIFNIIGGSAAVLQIIGTGFLFRDFKKHFINPTWMISIIMIVFILKNVLQLFSAFPDIAALAYQYKNLIIAYLHLVLLGFVSLFVFYTTLKSKQAKWGILTFLFAFITTELILVLNALGSIYGFVFRFYNESLVFFSIFFPMGILMMIRSVKLRLKRSLHCLSYQRT